MSAVVRTAGIKHRLIGEVCMLGCTSLFSTSVVTFCAFTKYGGLFILASPGTTLTEVFSLCALFVTPAGCAVV